MTDRGTRKRGRRWTPWGVAWALCLVTLPGCGPDYEADVSGMVTLDGQLLDSGTVVFHPTDGGPPAYGHIHGDGSFVMQIGQGDQDDPAAGGIRPGEYQVTVVARRPPPDGIGVDGGPPDPGPLITPEKYARPETSGIAVQVKVGKQVVPIQLESEQITTGGMIEPPVLPVEAGVPGGSRDSAGEPAAAEAERTAPGAAPADDLSAEASGGGGQEGASR